MRNLRHFPPGSIVEVTTRTIQGRYLLTPSRLLNQIIVGVLGRAQRRNQAILISNEEEAQVARLKYVLAHGAKENLVASPQEWPGVYCVHPLLAGEWTSRAPGTTAGGSMSSGAAARSSS